MTDIEKTAEWYADKYYNKSNDTNIASKESFKEGACYAMDKIADWLFENASKYVVTLFNKDEFDADEMVNDLLTAIDEEEIDEEESSTN